MLLRIVSRVGLFTAAVLSTFMLSARRADAAYVFSNVYTLGQPLGLNSPTTSLFQPMFAGEIVGEARAPVVGISNHALLWTSSNPNSVDLHQAEWKSSSASAAMLGQEVGYAQLATNFQHAIVWTGSAASAIDLHPAAGYITSVANFTTGTRQVGMAFDGSANHAMLWSGSAASAVDLQPANRFESAARAADDAHQVGWAGSSQSPEAMMWSGTAQSAVNLHPGEFFDSVALGVGGNQQVGTGHLLGSAHALLWTGSAASMVDLHPAGFNLSVASATNGTIQVGYGAKSGDSYRHALLWSGSASSVIDLSLLRPAGWRDSYATSIGPDGTIYGMAIDAQGNTHAVIWTFVPEPASASAALLIALTVATARNPAGNGPRSARGRLN
ncbi:MAG: hypothetical protein H7Z14_10315 [Anaerolineae bacterium]|nr:hypothetical protein [Phycisphaerae bacterium]